MTLTATPANARSFRIGELAAIELRDRHASGTYDSFYAAKSQLNERGMMCAACSIQHHHHNGDAALLHPCASCKDKFVISAESLREAASLKARGIV